MGLKKEIYESAAFAFREKYVGRINKVLNEYLEQFELTADLAQDFFYDEREELVGYALATSVEADREFKEFVESLNPKFYYNDFIVGLFHEIGHHHTIYAIDEITRNDYECHRWDMSPIEYFSHPVEMEATVWAIEYIENHIEEVNALWIAVQPLIMDFFNALEREAHLWV